MDTRIKSMRGIAIVLAVFFSVCSAARAQNGKNIAARQDYAEVVQALKPFVQREMAGKDIPAISISIIDDQQTVWAEGFGFADPKEKKAATAETVYRIGSVSKLFTDIGIMQMVERGELNLDAPVTDYLPNFHPKNPFGTPITLRELMSHRSGLLREPPVGNYFETTEPTIAATVQSLNDTELVYAPKTHTKYSNAAIAVVGYLLQEKAQQPFAEYLKHTVLEPIGLQNSSFTPEPKIIANLAKAKMWAYDGRTMEAPTFQLGMAPAGSMYSTVLDLGRFVSVLLAQGKTEKGTLLKPETLNAMWAPQFPNEGGSVFGLGFMVGDLDGHRMVGHGGAIYGFATSVDLLPEEKVGVTVTATKDGVNTVTERIAQEALRLVLAHRAGKPLSIPPATGLVSAEVGRKLVGRYGTGEGAVDLDYLDGHLNMLAVTGGMQTELRTLDGEFISDSAMDYGTRVKVTADGIQIGDKKLAKISVAKPVGIPQKWEGLIGEYGWDHDIVYVFEKDNHINVLIEWMEFDQLKQDSETVFSFPKHGLYDGEKAVFSRDAKGEATQVKISGVVFKRRAIGGVNGGIFKIQTLRPVNELRAEALAAKPPVETGDLRKPDLVELTSLDPTIKLDIRYATKNNFLDEPVYKLARAYMERPAAEAVVRANHKLKELGFGLLIHDSYRPWYVTRIFWDATPDDKKIFVADPSHGSRHNRGCAVDLTLYDLKTGKAIPMTGVYDEMSERSYPAYPGGTSLQRWHREILRKYMEDEGLWVYPFEWWHFDYQEWNKYPIINIRFEDLSANAATNKN